MAPTNEQKHEETYTAAEATVRGLDPVALAARAGATWTAGSEPGTGEITLSSLGTTLTLTWPTLTFSAADPALLSFPWRLITLHYLATATGEPPGTDWVGYREIPGGLFYADTIAREVERPLGARFGEDPDLLLAAAAPLGGEQVEVADVAVVFHPFPYVPVVVALWLADEDFPAQAKVLYERRGVRSLPLQDLRLLADFLWSFLRRRAETGTPPSAAETQHP